MAKKILSPKERRRFPRVPLDIDLNYKVNRLPDVRMKTDSVEDTSHLINISEGGIAFVSPVDMPVSTGLDLTFNLIAGKARKSKIMVKGETRYSILRADYRTYQVGVEFIKIKASDRKHIAFYVKSQLRRHAR
jgi:c-di-GMP-binding flagellar brake protein YcgR